MSKLLRLRMRVEQRTLVQYYDKALMRSLGDVFESEEAFSM
ncbi:hypothetical protein [Paenibacillus sp. 7516]|nr:hypothetical protein [Paenibacillus sp. 7516]